MLVRERAGAAIYKSGSVLDFSKILGVIGCSKVAHMLAPPGMHGVGNTQEFGSVFAIGSIISGIEVVITVDIVLVLWMVLGLHGYIPVRLNPFLTVAKLLDSSYTCWNIAVMFVLPMCL